MRSIDSPDLEIYQFWNFSAATLTAAAHSLLVFFASPAECASGLGPSEPGTRQVHECNGASCNGMGAALSNLRRVVSTTKGGRYGSTGKSTNTKADLRTDR